MAGTNENNNFTNFCVLLNSMKSSGILETNPDFEKSFEDSLTTFFAIYNHTGIADKVTKVMGNYRKVKELLLEIYADLQINTNK